VEILLAVSSDFTNPALSERVRIALTSDSEMLLFRVLEHGEECAFVALRPEDDETIEMEEIFVVSERRGGGLGAKIIEAIVGICHKLGKHRITVWVNTASRSGLTHSMMKKMMMTRSCGSYVGTNGAGLSRIALGTS
jgi:GNAT superfamily N-acetyltransferase